MKNIFISIIMLTTILACKKDEPATISPEEQASIDDAKIVDYMKSHSIKPFHEGEIANNIDWKVIKIEESATHESLYDLMKNNIIESTVNGVKYKMYYYNIKEGEGNTPSESDTVYVDYKLFSFSDVKYDSSPSLSVAKFDLNNLIRGWQLGIQKIKSGKKPADFPGIYKKDYDVNPYREYISSPGKAILLLPSGLAYGPSFTGNIPPNEVLRFDIVLYDIAK